MTMATRMLSQGRRCARRALWVALVLAAVLHARRSIAVAVRWSDAQQCAEGGPCMELRDVLDDVLASRACLSLYDYAACDPSCARSVRAHVARSLWHKCVTRCKWRPAVFLDAVLDWAALCEARALRSAEGKVQDGSSETDDHALVAADEIDIDPINEDVSLAEPQDEQVRAVIEGKSETEAQGNEAGSRSSVKVPNIVPTIETGAHVSTESDSLSISTVSFVVVAILLSGAVALGIWKAATNVRKLRKDDDWRKARTFLTSMYDSFRRNVLSKSSSITSNPRTVNAQSGNLRGARRHIRTDYWNTLDTR